MGGMGRHISIHAPLRERQWVNLCGEQENPISILAPSRERQACHNISVDVIYISILAPSRERLKLRAWKEVKQIFQSTLPHGSDPCRLQAHCLHRDFNPRSPAGATRAAVAGDGSSRYFNPRSLAGATSIFFHFYSI